MICNNIGRTAEGHLSFAGYDTVRLAEKYGTPLYLMDEERIRYNCRVYKSSMTAAFGENALPIYASKACSFKRIYNIIAEEGLGADLVSAGEIYTAYKAGFPMEKAFFHGNNKTDDEIAFAMEHGVGYFMVDGEEELSAVNSFAAKYGKVQKIILRLTPGIDPHTFEAVATGKVDSKFGVAIETGQAEEFVAHALKLQNVSLEGYHCHVGSQVFDRDGSVYPDGAGIMLSFCAEMQKKYGYFPKILNMGGGYGVRYVESDPPIDIGKNILMLGEHFKRRCDELGIPVPAVHMEPGRSIVADAGMTLYTVGTVKCITGYKNYISIDGGMTDDPRYALYGSQYTVLNADRPDDSADFFCDLVGRNCESDDVIQPDVTVPRPVRGERMAVCTTGAYNYSMASNYNRVPRPPVVMLADRDYIAVRRETLDDLLLCDL